MVQRILLVDDRPDNLVSIESILEPEGYQIIKANSGNQALKILLNQFDFALILMDVKMPNLNGFETAALIYERQKLRHIPIIFITAHSYGEENIFKGYRTGGVDYIYKPINPDLLRAKVAVFIELYQKNHRLMAQEQKLIAINRNLEHEIKERIASEEKVNKLNHELLENINNLETANKDLDRFAFMASHDLQEPLRKIRTFSDRLLSKYNETLDDDGKLYLARIQNSAARMQTLIHDILTFSKISIQNEYFVETDLNTVMSDALNALDDLVHQKNAKILVENLPKLRVNPGLMQPLFFNLIGNSLKYSKTDIAPEIKIRSEIITLNSNGDNQQNKYCRIYFEDNGIGFDQQFSEQIFGMFQRLHVHTEFEGTGIGLALCKKIVEQHKGFISAKSKPNEGATFIVSLPFQPVNNSAMVLENNS
jgi:signal transduction histidine kinase